MKGSSTPPRTVVKEYGRDGILFAAVNPLLSVFMARVLGLQPPVPSAERIALAMERDAVAMAQRGYHVASSHERTFPLFGVTYRRVTYELDARRDVGRPDPTG